MHIAGAETRRCPPEFQERLTRKFGVNQFGDPHFKISWCQSQFIRLGFHAKDNFGRERFVYRDRYQGDGSPCWMIMQWKPAGHYGSPESYYSATWLAHRTAGEDPSRPYDTPDGCYVMGEYPWRGRYEIVVPLVRKDFKDNKLIIDHFPLSHFLIDTLIPLILEWQKLSVAQREAAKRAEEEAEHKRQVQHIADYMDDARPAWYGPVSFSRQGVRTSLIDRKMFAIQQKWNQMAKLGLTNFQRGFSQGDRPMILRSK